MPKNFESVHLFPICLPWMLCEQLQVISCNLFKSNGLVRSLLTNGWHPPSLNEQLVSFLFQWMAVLPPLTMASSLPWLMGSPASTNCFPPPLMSSLPPPLTNSPFPWQMASPSLDKQPPPSTNCLPLASVNSLLLAFMDSLIPQQLLSSHASGRLAMNPQLWNRGRFYRNDKSQLQPTVVWWLPMNFGFFHSQPEHGSHAHFVEACVLDSYISINVNVNNYNPYILAITMIWGVFCLERLEKALCIIYYRVHYKNGSKDLLSIISCVKAALSANEHTHGANGFYDQVMRW